MRVRITLTALALMAFTSCYYIGCYSVHDACYDCCKETLKQMRGVWGGKRAYDAREPCTEECEELADKQKKDGYWVERERACQYGNPDAWLEKVK